MSFHIYTKSIGYTEQGFINIFVVKSTFDMPPEYKTIFAISTDLLMSKDLRIKIFKLFKFLYRNLKRKYPSRGSNPRPQD